MSDPFVIARRLPRALAGRIACIVPNAPYEISEPEMTNTSLPSPDCAIDSAAESHDADVPETVHEDCLWRDGGWTARVIKN